MRSFLFCWPTLVVLLLTLEAIGAQGEVVQGPDCHHAEAKIVRPEQESVWIRGEVGIGFDSMAWDGNSLTVHSLLSAEQGCKFLISTEFQPMVGGSKMVIGRNTFEGSGRKEGEDLHMVNLEPGMYTTIIETEPAGSMLPVRLDFKVQDKIEDLVEQNADGESVNVIGLMRVRNVERSIASSLQALSRFTHAIVMLDDSSEDGTVQQAQSVAEECGVEGLLLNAPGGRSQDRYSDMQRLLEAGRDMGGTHFVVVHSDEMLTTSFIDEGSSLWWDALTALKIGDSLTLSWVHMWKNMRYIRADWLIMGDAARSLRYVDVAFRDDGQCSFLSNRAEYDDARPADFWEGEEEPGWRHWGHGHDTRRFAWSRIPLDLKGGQVMLYRQSHVLMHFGYIDWQSARERMLMMRLETLKQQQHAPDIFAGQVMREVMDEGEVFGIHFQPKSLSNWTEMGLDLVGAWGAEEDTLYKEVLARGEEEHTPRYPRPGSDGQSDNQHHIVFEAKGHRSSWYAAEIERLIGSSARLKQASHSLRWPTGRVPSPPTAPTAIFEDHARAHGHGEAAERATTKSTKSAVEAGDGGWRERHYEVENAFVAGGSKVRLWGERLASGAPRVSVLLISKRPGGLDSTLASLGKQTRRDFEVIIVDELWQREGEIRRFAAKHGVPLSVVTTSKPRSSPAAYGFQNAWNTALSFARGAYVAITNDYTWLQQNFIETIIEFYESEASTLPFCARFDANCPDSGAAWRDAETSGTWDLGARGFTLLSFPVIKFDPPEGAVNRTALSDPGRISTFDRDMEDFPRDWMVSDPLGPLDTREVAFKPHFFWDGQAVVAPRSIYELLNGFDEALDAGNDYHLENIAWRASLAGASIWLAPVTGAVLEINHHNFSPRGETDEFLLFSRLPGTSNRERQRELTAMIRRGEYPLRSPNGPFDLSQFYRRQHEGHGSSGRGKCSLENRPDNWRCHFSDDGSGHL